ncbi:unnamed protein product [Phytophthora fragariaefolia]|uniref:Unnamed protein product n=1 Tax=Phytophthora fragariaefolia TaxID=1490495 RepID=A0A9W6Y5U5_9STRA|nr:unnamed protein product [Phytophthora fragariaefolia]
MSASGSPTSSAPSPVPASTASPSASRSVVAAPPVAPVAPAPRVKLEGSGTASATASRLPLVYRSSAAPALTLADLERVLKLRDNRLEFAQAERDVKLGKLVSYAVAKPFPEPSHELFRRLQGSSSIDELVAALEKEIVGGPHPAVVAGEQQVDAFAARARADLLEHELRETMKRVFQLEESDKTASALSTNLERDSWSTERIRLDATIRDKERVIASMTADYCRDAGNHQLVLGRCYELMAQVRQPSDAVAMGNTSAHQHLKRQLTDKDNEIRRLLRTIRMSPVASEFQRRNPFLVVAAILGELVSRLLSLGPPWYIRRAKIVTTRAGLLPSVVPGEQLQLIAARSSDCFTLESRIVLGEAAAISSSSDCDRQASSRSAAVSSTSASPPSSQMTSSSPTQAPPGSGADLASANASVSPSALANDLEGADASGVERSSTSRQTEAASTLASLSGATKPVVIHALPPGKHPAWSPSDSDSDGGNSTGGGSAATPPNLSIRLVESPDPSGDGSTRAGASKPKSQASSTAGSGSPPLASPTVAVRPPQVTTSAPVSATAKAPVSSKTPPLARSPVRSETSTSKLSLASKAKVVVPTRSAKDASKPKPASKAKSPAAIRSAKDGSKPKSASKPSASKAKLTALDTKARAKSDGGVPPHHVDVKVLVARAAASARLHSRESGPMKRLLELPFFYKGSKRCWEKIMRSCAVSVTMKKTADGERIKPTPCSIAGLAAFMDVDDSGHPWRSKPGSMLDVLSHEWCKSRGVVREDILLALWERIHWIVESSVNIYLDEACLASERTSRIDNEFTALWKSLKDYLLGRKQRSDLLRLTVKVLGDAVVGAANHKIDGLPAPLVDTEVCFDPAIPFSPPVNLPWFPRTAYWIAEAVRIDNHEPWRLWWVTAPGRHPYNTIFQLYHPEFPLFIPDGANSEMVAACVKNERLIVEPEPPALHPNTPAPVNRPGEIEFCPPNIVHSA